MFKLDYLQKILNKDEYINYKQIEGMFLIEKKYKQMIEEHNRVFIKNKLIEYKEYFDHIYDEINPNIQLDINQRIAILTDEDYNLVIAGAGSGKTTTM